MIENTTNTCNNSSKVNEETTLNVKNIEIPNIAVNDNIQVVVTKAPLNNQITPNFSSSSLSSMSSNSSHDLQSLNIPSNAVQQQQHQNSGNSSLNNSSNHIPNTSSHQRSPSDQTILVTPQSPSLTPDTPDLKSIVPKSTSSSPVLSQTSPSTPTIFSPSLSPSISSNTLSSSSSSSSTPSLDLIKYFKEIENSLRNDALPVAQLQMLIQILDKSKKLENDQMMYFLNVWFPKYVLYVLSFKNLTAEIKLHIIKFLKGAIEISIEYIHTLSNDFKYEDIWLSIARIFNPNHSFYTPNKIEINKEDIPDNQIFKLKLADFQTSVQGTNSNSNNNGSTSNNNGGNGNGGGGQSIYYYYNLNVLSDCGYFDKFLQLITQRPSLSKLKSAMKPLHTIRDELSVSFLQEYIPKLKENIFNYLLDLFYEDLPTGERDHYREIYQYLQHLLAVTNTPLEISRMFQEFDLNRALRCFLSVNLEKKLRGLRFIKKESTKCIKTETSKSFAFTNFLKKPKSKQGGASGSGTKTSPLPSPSATPYNASNQGGSSSSPNQSPGQGNSGTGGTNQSNQSNQNQNSGNNSNNNSNNNAHPPLIYEWVLKNEIIESCCKLCDQPDIMRHCIPVMIFLSQYGKLETKHIELLWKSTIGKHESVKNIIFSAILALINYMSIQLVDYLYDLIQKTFDQYKASDFDQEFLMFLYNFSTVAIQHQDNSSSSTQPSRSGAKQLYGLELFYRLAVTQHYQILDDKNYHLIDNQALQISQNLVSNARSHFVNLLKLSEYSSYRNHYLEMAVENLRTQVNVYESLAIIVNTIDQKKVKAHIEVLEQKFKIFDLLFKEISQYKRTTLERSKFYNATGPTQSLNKAIFQGQFPHLLQVQARLDFLEFIISQSNLMLNHQQVDILWDSFVTMALTQEERETYFIWLKNTKLSTSNSKTTIPESVIKHLFMEKMSSLDWSHLGPSSYSVFERFFFFINERSGKIKKIQQSIFNTGDGLFGGSNQFSLSGGNIGSGNASSLNNNSLQKPKSSPLLSSTSPNITVSSPHMYSTPNNSGGNSNNGNSNAGSSPVPSPQSSPLLSSVNYQSTSGNSNVTGEFYIVSIDLLGINYFWSIALDSVHLEFSNSAINTLIQLYSSENSKSSVKYKEEFLKICIDHLQKNLLNLKQQSNQQSPQREELVQRVCRVLIMMKQFRLENTSKGSMDEYKSPKPHHRLIGSLFSSPSTPRDEPMKPNAYFVKLDRGDSHIVPDVYGSDTLRTFKRKIANLYNIQPKPTCKSLKVYLVDKELKDDDKSMDEFKILDSNGVQSYPILVKRTVIVNSNVNNNNNNNNNNISTQQQQQPQQNEKKLKNQSKKKDGNGSGNNSDESSDDEDLGDMDVLDDTPVASMVIESIQHQLGGIGLVGDLVLRKVQENPKSRLVNGKVKNEDFIGGIIAKSQFFDQIFNLLNLDDHQIAENAWELLADLPYNEKLYKDIKLLREDLNVLFPTNTIYKTLYSLKVFESIMEMKQGGVHTFTLTESSSLGALNYQVSSDEIKEKFIQKQGVNYLITLFTNSDISSQSGYIRFYGALLKSVSLLTLKNSGEKPSYSMQKRLFRKETSYSISPAFTQKLFRVISGISVISSASSPPLTATQSEDLHIAITFGLEILLTSLVYNYSPDQLLDALKLFDWKTWLKSLLLECNDRSIQIKVSNALLNLTTNFQNPQSQSKSIDISLYFVAILLSFLPEINNYSTTSEQYFCLLSELLNIGYPVLNNTNNNNNNNNNSTNDNSNYLIDLLGQLIEKIKVIPIRENTAYQQKDHILNGILNVIRNLIRRRPSLKSLCKETNLIEFLWYDGLFKTPTANDHGGTQPPLCKTKDSRVNCFRLLRELTKNDYETFFKVERFIIKEIESTDAHNDWNYSPFDKEKTMYGYVGLKNQGATCYMNSLVQQLYYSPHLKKGLLSLNLIHEQSNQHVHQISPMIIGQKQQQQQQSQLDDKLQSEYLLNQLQLLFIYLQESSKRYYDPYNFCRSIKNYDGTYINLGVQMDAYEFFLILLDKLEESLKVHPNQKDLLKESFGGVFTNQFISKECTHRSHREEPFLSISLEVKNKKSLLESFNSFVEPEYLVGNNKYKCEGCDTRVDAMKRCLIDKLPNTLILHMKRFEYDLDNMRNIKLNDFCEFPMVLDTEPYCFEPLDRKEKNQMPVMADEHPDKYKYTLSGIVLHQGTADSGHYITLIKDNQSGNWFELNDTLVQAYDPNRIPIDCFGGFDDVKEMDKETQKVVTVKRPKTCNAYMLFYTKSIPNEYPSSTPIPMSPLPTLPNLNVAGDQQRSSTPPNLSSSTTSSSDSLLKIQNNMNKISHSALEMVWNENSVFLTEKFLYDLDFGNFIWDTVNLYHQPTFDEVIPVPNRGVPVDLQKALLSSIKLSVRYLIDIYAHSKEKGIIDVWAYHIKRLMRDCVEGAEWLLAYLCERKALLKSILVSCYFEKTRNVFVNMLTFAVKLVKNHYGKQPDGSTVPIISLFCRVVLSLIKSYNEYSKRAVQQLFTLIFNIVQGCEEERELLLQKGLISKLVDTFVGVISSTTSFGYGTSSGYSIMGGNNSSISSSVTSSNMGSSSGNSSTVVQQPNEPNKMLDLLSYLIRYCQYSPNPAITILQYPSEREKNRPRMNIILDKQSVPTTSPFKSSSYPTNVGPDSYVYAYSDPTLVAILSKMFLIKLVKEYGWNDSAKHLFKHLAWENKTVSTHLLTIIKDSMAKNFQSYYNIFSCSTALLEMNDSISTWRIETYMTYFLKIIDNMIIQESQEIFIKYISRITGVSSSTSTPFQPITTDEFITWRNKNKDLVIKTIKDSYYR
ncbi:hypothetical protein DLAC_04405 [Tieghemostelium lacteum]|uniref:USP domain-containing protein n=1 Tax=Tieghemostelium lacteum TaxID=361077 RepID=A0A151ZJY2_TIELA|nr:hypothetical protein DLAC_04405 [Tieghemostelium lacteum]|eukprot:KYQ94124.1 hypothetical protein DLAC_04405 [Tieghemostelium lacteum]